MFFPVKIRSFGIPALIAFLVMGASAYAAAGDTVPAHQTHVPILLYHHIGELPAGAGRARQRWTLSAGQFDAQMRWIAENGFSPVTMAQLSGHLKLGLPLPAKPIVISFDDGWKDQYDVALPILKKYRFVATFFIITDSVGHSATMTWDQIRKMSDAGMDIESHSRTHERLSILPPAQAWEEISGSKKILEKQLHKKISVFAYPFGSYSDEVIRMVKDAGFDAAATVSGLNGGYLFRADRAYTLGRYAVEREDVLDGISHLKSAQGSPCPSLFVSLVQNPSIFSSRESIDALMDFSVRAGISVLFVQVYRANQSWFASRVADASPYESGRRRLGFDPFGTLLREAHRRGIQVHAWMNMLSLAQNENAPFLKAYGTEVLTRNTGEKKKLSDYMIDRQYFLEPGDPRVRRDLGLIVGELLTAYPDLDGIQFDYIRYPDTDPHYGYTASNVARFKKATGAVSVEEKSPAWMNWRRAQVTELLAFLVKSARAVRADIQVSATGCMPYVRAAYEAYQDWPSWINSALIDFVTVMNYSPNPDEFKRWLSVVKEKISDPSRVRVGVGAYKLTRSSLAFEREVRDVEEAGMTCAVFHYGSLLESPGLRSIVINENEGI